MNRIRFMLALSMASLAGVTSAQETYPSRPVTIVVPFPPGGAADLATRPLAIFLEKTLKQPIVISNRPGAGGAIGMTAVANAKPDGYTLLSTLVSFNSLPEVDALFQRKPNFTRDQFVPIARLTADPPLLVANPAAQWKSVKELVAAAKKQPGEMIYSHSGVYGPSHTPIEMFAAAAGIRLRQLPVVGGAPAMTAVLGGHATMWASPPAIAAPHIRAGKVNAFATWGAERNPLFPTVPTLTELGYKVEWYTWAGMFAPRETPAAIVKTLRDAVRVAATSPEYRASMEKVVTAVGYMDAPEFQKFLEVDAKRSSDAIRQIGKLGQ